MKKWLWRRLESAVWSPGTSTCASKQFLNNGYHAHLVTGEFFKSKEADVGPSLIRSAIAQIIEMRDNVRVTRTHFEMGQITLGQALNEQLFKLVYKIEVYEFFQTVDAM